MPEIEVGNKRTTEFTDYDDEVKKAKIGGIGIRLLLLGRYGGLIVGKGGENLAKLRTEHNVKLDMSSGRTNDRVFAVQGDIEDITSLTKEVLDKCPQAPYPVGQKSKLELNLLVSTDAVGRIIGKGGEKLKEIRDQTNGRVKVYQECLPHSNERVVAIGGDAVEEAIAAFTTIVNLLQDSRGSLIPYDPNNKPSDIMGFGMNSTGMMAPAMQQGYQGTVNSGGMGGGMSAGNESEFQQVPTVTTLTVTNEMCGAIIGKAGIRIREIRSSSGAKIDFSESDKVSKADRTITISGTQHQVNAAEQLMSQCVRNRMN